MRPTGTARWPRPSTRISPSATSGSAARMAWTSSSGSGACGPSSKILVLTAYPSIDALQTATNLGVAGFLSKPLGMPELLCSVDRVLGSELGPFLLFPSTLKEKLKDVVPYLGEVTSVDPSNWLRVKTLLRTAAPSCVLVDAAAPDVLDFFDACKRELEGRIVLLLCRDDDFVTARELLGRLSNVKCVSMGGSP